MNKQNIIGAIAVIAFLGVLFLAFTKPEPVAAPQPEVAYGASGANTVLPTGVVLPNPSPFDYLVANKALQNVGVFLRGGYTPTTAYEETQSIGSCSTASSTIIAVLNPFAATTTLANFTIVGTMGATTSDIVVATSTTAFGGPYATATSSVKANIMGLAGVLANSQFYSVAGANLGPGTGYTNPATAAGMVTNTQVVVGPTEYVIAVSTSTGITGGAGANATGLRAIPSSCTYKMLWRL